MRFFCVILPILAYVGAFAPAPLANPSRICLFEATEANTIVAGTDQKLEPKEAVKLFGRLAEKYIMLDSTGGLCCYSGCTGERRVTRDGDRGTHETEVSLVHCRLRVSSSWWWIPNGGSISKPPEVDSFL